jgi:hypothetical protein
MTLRYDVTLTLTKGGFKMSYFNKKKFTMRQMIGLLTIVFLGVAAIGYTVTIPNSFTGGNPILASEMNTNFTALKTAVDALEAKVNTLGVNLPLASRQGKMGYAWADLPTSASYTPDTTYSFSSSGGAITATRSAVGTYAITFSGIGSGIGGVDGGHVQVSAYRTNTRCVVNRWSAFSWPDVTIYVDCYDSTGTAADSRYDVLFVM